MMKISLQTVPCCLATAEIAICRYTCLCPYLDMKMKMAPLLTRITSCSQALQKSMFTAPRGDTHESSLPTVRERSIPYSDSPFLHVILKGHTTSRMGHSADVEVIQQTTCTSGPSRATPPPRLAQGNETLSVAHSHFHILILLNKNLVCLIIKASQLLQRVPMQSLLFLMVVEIGNHFYYHLSGRPGSMVGVETTEWTVCMTVWGSQLLSMSVHFLSISVRTTPVLRSS